MTLFAEHVPWNLDILANSLLAAAAFGLLGIALLVLGFKVFEWITPKLHVEEELGKGNVAVGIVVAAAILGVAFIVVRAIGG
jgi:putative membrane protein